MEDNIILSGEMQEVAETADVNDTGLDAVSVEENGSGEMQEVAVPATDDRSKADAAFAEMRRKWQTSESERNIASERLDRAKSLLERFGFSGESYDDVFDAADAHFTGQDVESIRRERTERQKALNEQNALQREVEHYRKQEVQRKMAEDLKAIRKIDPSVASLDELGEDYFNLIRAGFDGVTAFTAVRTKANMNKKEAPPVTGRINSKTVVEKEYFTEKELNSLSSKDLDDPAVLAKALKSMTKK